jgi:integrase
LKCEHARRLARIELGKVAGGGDPAADRRETRRKSQATVTAVLDRFDATLVRRGYANRSGTMSTLRRGLASVLHRDIASLDRAGLVALIDAKEAAGLPGAAADLRKHAHTLLNWAANKGLCPVNPLAGYRREKATRALRIIEGERGRALTDDGIARLWLAACSDTALGRLIRALVLSGCRRSEMAKLRWEMDLGDRLLLPPSHTKQGRSHAVPVSAALRAVLAACPRTASPYVFASPVTDGPMSGWTQLVDKICRTAGIEFTLHDLRRTFRTGLTNLGADFDLAELMLGHQRDDLVRRYDRSQRWNERVHFAERWADNVLSAVAAYENGSRQDGAVISLNTQHHRQAHAAYGQ